MARELHHVSVAFTVDKPERLPLLPDGEQMYADDVVAEVSDVIAKAVDAWYQARGKDMLCCEPTL